MTTIEKRFNIFRFCSVYSMNVFILSLFLLCATKIRDDMNRNQSRIVWILFYFLLPLLCVRRLFVVGDAVCVPWYAKHDKEIIIWHILERTHSFQFRFVLLLSLMTRLSGYPNDIFEQKGAKKKNRIRFQIIKLKCQQFSLFFCHFPRKREQRKKKKRIVHSNAFQLFTKITFRFVTMIESIKVAKGKWSTHTFKAVTAMNQRNKIEMKETMAKKHFEKKEEIKRTFDAELSFSSVPSFTLSHSLLFALISTCWRLFHLA